jgi:hypothetical protein
MLYREIIAVCSEIHVEHKYTVWAKRTVFTSVRKIAKATISDVMSVCRDFREIWYFSIFRKSVDTSSFVNIWEQ